jgi:type II secretory pathway component PulM
MLLKPLQTLSALFQTLERRERLLLSLALWLLLPLVVLLAWFEPMMQSRQRLHERLERLDRERATMQALAQQWRSLDEQAPTVKRQDLETRIQSES